MSIAPQGTDSVPWAETDWVGVSGILFKYNRERPARSKLTPKRTPKAWELFTCPRYRALRPTVSNKADWEAA